VATTTPDYDREVRRKSRETDDVISITSAPEPLADDLARRTRRYLLQMGIRTLCFVLAVVLWGVVPMWVSLLFIVGAVVLPYVAVLFANAGRERTDIAPSYVEPRAITASRDERTDHLDPTDRGHR
jgi:Flp pilus assembly protein TadB